MCIKCAERNHLNALAILALAQAAEALGSVTNSDTQANQILNTISQLTYKEQPAETEQPAQPAQAAEPAPSAEANGQAEPSAELKASIGSFIEFLGKALSARVIKLEPNDTGSGHQWMFRAPRDVSYNEVMEMVAHLSKECGIPQETIVIV